MLKRGFDLAVAAFALILLSPIVLAVAVAVRVTSRGPVLFRQTRVGLDGRNFTMLKFRSMRTGSSPEIHSEYARHWIYGRTGSTANGNGSGDDPAPTDTSSDVHKMTNDPRITAVGKVLRATSLDELPQFWNVVRGEMSIVGPRPALPYEVDRYTEWHKRRLAVPPGITGAWQVSGRSDLSFKEMVELDVDYIARWSVESDIKIVLKTVPAVFKFGGR
jgi:lipopolysaccharide/colanic/teichoic acid biosynthesis glycosyltransferase